MLQMRLWMGVCTSVCETLLVDFVASKFHLKHIK